MSGGALPTPSPRVVAVDVGLVVLTLGLTLATVVIVVSPVIVPGLINDRLDVTIVAAATLVTGAVAALGWARGRVANDPSALLRGSAFAVLALLNGLTLLAGVTGADAALGAAIDHPGQLPLFAGVVARGVAAMLLMVAGTLSLSRAVPAVRPAVILLLPAVVVLAALAAGTIFADALPAFASPEALDALSDDPTAAMALSAEPLLVVIQGLVGAGFLAAAVMARRAYHRGGRAGDALMAAGLVIAAFSQVHAAMHPGAYSGVVTSGDLLRLAFYAVLLIGVVAESRADLADLRRATLEVRRLAEAEFAAVTLEERARLAREIHDGLAQDLWYAKLKQSRLTQVGNLTGEAARLGAEVETAIDSALAEARHAVSAMRGGAESGPLLDILRRQVEDFADRFAIQADFAATGPEPEIGPRAQAELVRIVQEALTNIRKHADATVVRVTVESDGELRIGIADNGRGFRVENAPAGFGLESMRQRADVIGARLSVTSAPQDGSRIELAMPIGRREELGGR